jgi:hypothetical protein
MLAIPDTAPPGKMDVLFVVMGFMLPYLVQLALGPAKAQPILPVFVEGSHVIGIHYAACDLQIPNNWKHVRA